MSWKNLNGLFIWPSNCVLIQAAFCVSLWSLCCIIPFLPWLTLSLSFECLVLFVHSNPINHIWLSSSIRFLLPQTPACLWSFFFLCFSFPLKYYWTFVKLGNRQYTPMCCFPFSLSRLGSVKVFFFFPLKLFFFVYMSFTLEPNIVTCEIWFGRKSVWEY